MWHPTPRKVAFDALCPVLLPAGETRKEKGGAFCFFTRKLCTPCLYFGALICSRRDPSWGNVRVATSACWRKLCIADRWTKQKSGWKCVWAGCIIMKCLCRFLADFVGVYMAVREKGGGAEIRSYNDKGSYSDRGDWCARK